MNWHDISFISVLCGVVLLGLGGALYFSDASFGASPNVDREMVQKLNSNFVEAKWDVLVLESGVNRSRVNQFCTALTYDGGYPNADFGEEQYEIHCYTDDGGTTQTTEYAMRGERFRTFVRQVVG